MIMVIISYDLSLNRKDSINHPHSVQV